MAKKGKNKGYSYRYNKSGTVTCRAYFDMPYGNRDQLSATGKTEEESRKKLLDKYAKICKEGKKIKPNNYTVKSWLNYWLNEVKSDDLKGGTYDGYYSSFKNHVLPVIGKLKLKDLKLDDIQKVVNKAKKTTFKKYGKTQKISAKGVKEIIAPLKQALIYAMDNNFMPYINFKNLSMPKEKKEEKKEKSKSRSSRPNKEQEIVTKYFRNEIPNLPFDLKYAPICVMDLRGIRPEECAGLQWMDIDYEQDILWVR